MPTARDLRNADHKTLRAAISGGHPIDPKDLEGWVYRGTSLGLPRVVEAATWKTFQKTFWRDPQSGRLLGWNVRLEQDGIDAPSRPKLRDGVPVTEWHYEVVSPEGVPTPPGFDRGLIIDYGKADTSLSVRFNKDPLVALSPGSAEELIGVTYAVVGGRCIETPTYFTLEREAPIDFVPYEHESPRGIDPLRLTAVERSWAEMLFASILSTGSDASSRLPPYQSIDPSTFWRCFDQAPAPLVRAGLRPMLYTLTFLPIAKGFGKPFFLLSEEARVAFLERASQDNTYFVRQALVTLKTLACFAYFDDPDIRARYASAAIPEVSL